MDFHRFPSDILDVRVALTNCGGDHYLLAEIAGLFIRDTPRRLALLRLACRQRDRGQLEFVAHSLKGSVATFGAHLAADAAACVERLAAGGKIEDALTAALVLDGEILRAIDALEMLARDPASQSCENAA